LFALSSAAVAKTQAKVLSRKTEYFASFKKKLLEILSLPIDLPLD
jgi:hypothetical protein